MSSDVGCECPVSEVGVADRPRTSRLPTAVYVLAAVNVCIGIGYGIAAPVIPVLAKSFEVSNTSATMVVSLYAATRVVLAPLAARMALWIPPGTLMSCALVVTAVTSVFAGLADTFLGLLLWRGLGGGGTAITTVAGQALLYRAAPLEALGRSSSVFHTGFLVGAVLGPVVGGALAAWSVQAPLVAYGCLLLVGAVIAASLLRSGSSAMRSTAAGAPGSGGRGEGMRVRHAAMPMREALADRRYRTVLAVNFSQAWIGNGLRFTVIPLYVVVALGRGPTWTGIGLLLAGSVQLALVLPSGRFVDRSGPRLSLLIGGATAVAGVLLMLPVFGLGGFLAGMSVLGLSAALTTPAASALLGGVLAGRGGPPLAGFQMVFDVATIFAPLACGLLSDEVGFTSAFLLSALVGVLSFIAVVRMPRTPAPVARPDVAPIPPQPE